MIRNEPGSTSIPRLARSPDSFTAATAFSVGCTTDSTASTFPFGIAAAVAEFGKRA